MNRRRFISSLAAIAWSTPRAHAAAPFPVQFRQQPPWTPITGFVDPGLDDFASEKTAMEIEAGLQQALASGRLPLAPSCAGASPCPSEYRTVASGVSSGIFSHQPDIAAGWRQWRAGLGAVRAAHFYSLPGDIVRYDIRSTVDGRTEQRVGFWGLTWRDGAITSLKPLEETLTHSAKPWFHDVTAHAFEGAPSFRQQLARGVPYWRSRLDPACGIDLYGENGVAAADIDGDGVDEIYVCQPGGLPNRLYKFDQAGRLRDIAPACGLDFLDDTASALFVDLRNLGRQDLLLVRSSEPILFLNDGAGHFTPLPDAFQFATPPQGSFTSVAAADFDRDGRLDLYFCCYVYYQSEAQYRYPVPYHDARNGPPNFLFRNRLNETPPHFEDVTESSGLNHNNNRFSFGATWCDYNADGWPDLYVTNDFGRKNLYRNTNGHFQDVAEEAGVADVGPGMSAAWLDYDGDGRPDLLVSNMWSASGQRIINHAAFGPVVQDPSLLATYQHHVKGNSLYHNSGDGTFTYTGHDQGIEIVPWSWSCDGADFDNDGSPELYIACGMLTNNGSADLMSYFYRQVVSKSPIKAMPAPAYENGWNAINQLVRQDYSWAGPEPNVFFARRAGRYYDFSAASGMDFADDSRSFAFVDFDGDGNLDMVLKSRLGPQLRVLQNDCGVQRHSLTISLQGTVSNRDAIGARVEVDGQAKWLTAGSAYLSQHTKKLHFGLGDRLVAHRVRILWPNGAVQEFGSLAAGQFHQITEGNSQIVSRPLRPRQELPRSGPLGVDNLARLETAWLWEPVPLPESRRGPALLVLHAGEPLPELGMPLQALDLRKAPADLAAGYAIFRRYLFDYRADLATPLWMLIDSASRVRKVYAAPPTAKDAAEDLRSLSGPLPDPRGLPLPGRYISPPQRDYYKFGGALLQAGYPEQALPYLVEMLRRNPDNVKALVAVGRVHLLAKRLPQAREALNRAMRLNPRLPEGWNELGGVETEAGNLAEALIYYEKALAVEPDFSYALLNAAQTNVSLGHADVAERLYRRALAADSNNGEAANGLGLVLAKQRRFPEARDLFQRAIAIRRDDASAINNLGVLYISLQQPNDAIGAFQYGISVAPDDETLYLNLARVLVQMGKREKATELMRGLLARKPTSTVAQKALKELGEL